MLKNKIHDRKELIFLLKDRFRGRRSPIWDADIGEKSGTIKKRKNGKQWVLLMMKSVETPSEKAKKASSIHKSSRKRDSQTSGEEQRVCSKGLNESLRVELNFSIGGDFLAPINNKKNHSAMHQKVLPNNSCILHLNLKKILTCCF